MSNKTINQNQLQISTSKQQNNPFQPKTYTKQQSPSINFTYNQTNNSSYSTSSIEKHKKQINSLNQILQKQLDKKYKIQQIYHLRLHQQNQLIQKQIRYIQGNGCINDSYKNIIQKLKMELQQEQEMDKIKQKENVQIISHQRQKIKNLQSQLISKNNETQITIVEELQNLIIELQKSKQQLQKSKQIETDLKNNLTKQRKY